MKKKRVCILCGNKLPVGNFGNNPEPVAAFKDGVCCDECNKNIVIPARLKQKEEHKSDRA